VAEALIGLAGVVIGTALGGTAKYWSLRRDAWRAARTSGLLLLADVRALRAAEPSAAVVANTRLAVATWEAHRQTLAGFRQGSFPNGFKAHEWLELAGHFARLEQIDADRQLGGDGWWSRAEAALADAERLLDRFESDPPVLGYVLRAGLHSSAR
jgi:hypothetical protein